MKGKALVVVGAAVMGLYYLLKPRKTEGETPPPPPPPPPDDPVDVRIDYVEEVVWDPDRNYRGWLLDATITNPHDFPVEKSFRVVAARYIDAWMSDRQTGITQTLTLQPGQSVSMRFDGSDRNDIYIRCLMIRFALIDEDGRRSEEYIYHV